MVVRNVLIDGTADYRRVFYSSTELAFHVRGETMSCDFPGWFLILEVATERLGREFLLSKDPHPITDKPDSQGWFGW
jgi:hypothetical protein